MATTAPSAAPSSILRLITCGSVDDGKSTLIGRLLYDAGLVHEDQLADLARDSARLGAAGEGLDFSLLLDGLEAEREQKITIDVAYRYFATPKRRFILADTPGHEQYTRNMATGASTADAAIVLVDARKGLLPQTRRHTQIVRMMGIRHVVLAVNKMDLVDFDEARFAAIRDAFSALTADMGLRTAYPVPVAAREGDNVVLPSEAMDWHKGPPLLAYLEALDAREAPVERLFRFPVQWVNRPNAEFRGFAGTVASGRAAPGDALVVLPAGTPARLQRIVTFEGEASSARAGEAVTLVLDREVDASRGDMLVPAADRPEVADQFRARIVWLGTEQLLPQRPYHMKIGTRTVRATVTELRHRLDLETGHEDVAKVLGQNEIGEINLSVDQAIPFDPYEENRVTGGFILIDRLSDETVAAGMIDFALRRAQNIAWQPLTIDKEARAGAKGQRPAVLWFTGLSGSGKSTIANLVESALFQVGRHTYLLDGDNVRHGLNRDLGFTDADRVENVRRVAEVARLMADAGLIVICSFISPFRAERRLARELLAPGEFVEIFVDTPIEVCEARDPKGLYAKARAGKIKNFTGIDSEFEIPEAPELVLEGHGRAPAENAAAVIALLQSSGIIR